MANPHLPFPREAYAEKREGQGLLRAEEGLGIEGAAEKDRECVCLSRCCLPRSFLRSSINETRMQSRRMSNKYVSYPSPPSLFFRFYRTVVFSSLLAGRLLILFLLDSHVTVSHRCSSSWIFLIPQLMCRLSPHTLTLSHVASVPRPFSLSALGRFDLERNHRTIRAYMFLTALGWLPSVLLGATIGFAWLRSLGLRF